MIIVKQPTNEEHKRRLKRSGRIKNEENYNGFNFNSMRVNTDRL